MYGINENLFFCQFSSVVCLCLLVVHTSRRAFQSLFRKLNLEEKEEKLIHSYISISRDYKMISVFRGFPPTRLILLVLTWIECFGCDFFEQFLFTFLPVKCGKLWENSKQKELIKNWVVWWCLM